MPDDGDRLTLEIYALFANTKMEATKAYLDRGRQFETATTSALKSRWISQLAAKADASPERDDRLYDDLESELNLRGIDAPADEVPEIVERLVARSKAQTDKWTNEQRKKVEDKLQEDIDKLQPKDGRIN